MVLSFDMECYAPAGMSVVQQAAPPIGEPEPEPEPGDE